MSTKTASSASVCTYCSKECKTIDSRPYPNSKSQERIHNKCRLKMAVAGKKEASESGEVKKPSPKANHVLQFNDASVAERLAQHKLELKKTIKPIKTAKSDTNSSQFFFDLTAGPVTGEKRKYLHHSKLTDFVSRYDQDGFKEEAIGRSYDASGKDLTLLEDEAELALEERIPSAAKAILSNQKPGKRKHEMTAGRGEGNQQKRITSQKQKCWFCLSSSVADKELVIGIGKHCYLALAKGGLTNDHLLIVPLEHVCSIRSESNSKELLQELEYYKDSLVKFYGSQSKAVVFYERNVKSFHWQLQVVPIPIATFDKIENILSTVSKKYYSKINFAPFKSKHYSLRDIVPTENTPYFSWESQSSTSLHEPIQLITLIDSNDADFPIQFGRMILADEEILNCPQKVDWKTCDKTSSDYRDLVMHMKECLEHLFDL